MKLFLFCSFLVLCVIFICCLYFAFVCLLNPPRIEDCDVRVFVSEFFRFEYCKDFRINKRRKQHVLGLSCYTANTPHARACLNTETVLPPSAQNILFFYYCGVPWLQFPRQTCMSSKHGEDSTPAL